MTTKTVYAIYLPSNRKGELKFLTHNQAYWSDSLKKTHMEFKRVVTDHMNNYDPPLTREEALEELGTPILYKLSVEKINVKQLG